MVIHSAIPSLHIPTPVACQEKNYFQYMFKYNMHTGLSRIFTWDCWFKAANLQLVAFHDISENSPFAMWIFSHVWKELRKSISMAHNRTTKKFYDFLIIFLRVITTVDQMISSFPKLQEAKNRLLGDNKSWLTSEFVCSVSFWQTISLSNGDQIRIDPSDNPLKQNINNIQSLIYKKLKN